MRACLALFLLPSIGFWASSGKDALIQLGIGGVLFLFTRSPTQTPKPLWLRIAATAGVLLGGTTRPHILLALLIALAIGQFFETRAVSKSGAAITFLRTVAFSAAALGGYFALLSFFSIDSLSNAVELQSQATNFGGSAIDSSGSLSLASLPAGLVSITIRPFPWEVGDVVGLIASVEGLAVTVLAFSSVLTSACLLYTSPSPRDQRGSRMPSSA